MIEAFLMSTGIVALAEMGDKTQLLSLVLAARYRKPVPIILGIFVATLLNHAVAGAVGAWLMHWFGPSVMRWVLGVSFLAMAIWILIPDKLDDTDADPKGGIFLTTVVAFFLAEMGDTVCDRGTGCAVHIAVGGGHGHHGRHDAGECACCIARRSHHPCCTHAYRAHHCSDFVCNTRRACAV